MCIRETVIVSKLKKHIGIYWKVPLIATDDMVAKATARAQTTARETKDYWRYQSNDLWDIQCEGFAMKSECDPRPPYMCSLDAKKVDTGPFKPNYWHTIDQVSAGFCGQGMFGGDISVNYSYGNCGISTTNHEWGHNHGLLHDGTRTGTGEEKEYGKTSLMGSNRRLYGLSSPHRVKLGFETEREILQIDSTTQMLIAPTEMSKHVLRKNEWQNVRVGRDYYISLRKAKGTRYPVSNVAPEDLYVHHMDRNDRDNIKLLTPTLKPGAQKVLPGGIIVKYHEYHEETARVTVQYKGQDAPEDLSMPKGPPVTLASSRITEAHSGAWWNPNFDGQGFDIEVKGDKVVIYNYTFDQSGGTQRYYLGNGEIKDGASVFDLYTTKGGTFDDPSKREEIKIGKAQLFFNDDDTGVFHFNTDEHGRGAVNLTKLATMVPSMFNGSWWNPERAGEGLSVKQYDKLLVVYWYTYDSQGNQKWYELTGTPDNLVIVEVRGGRWLFYDDVETPEIGEASIFINISGGITLKYDSRLLGIGSLELEKLF